VDGDERAEEDDAEEAEQHGPVVRTLEQVRRGREAADHDENDAEREPRA